MFICICKAITEKQLDDTIASGADNVSKIQKKCKAGSACGSCVNRIKERIKISNDQTD